MRRKGNPDLSFNRTNMRKNHVHTNECRKMEYTNITTSDLTETEDPVQVFNFSRCCYYEISITELENLVKMFLGTDDPDYNLCYSMDEQAMFYNGTVHTFEAYALNDEAGRCNHTLHLKELEDKRLANHKRVVQWNWEICSILTEMADRGHIPYGDYLLYISW